MGGDKRTQAPELLWELNDTVLGHYPVPGNQCSIIVLVNNGMMTLDNLV